MDTITIFRNIRRLRLASKQTLDTVAKNAGLTTGALSKIETGRISPPISTLVRIAQALKVPVVDLFFDQQSQMTYVITRKGEGQIVTRDGSAFGYTYEALALGKRDKYVEPFVLTVSPDDEPGEFHHTGQEFIYMLSGCLAITVCDQQIKLRAGDSFYFDSANIHRLQAMGKRDASFLCVFIQNTP